MTQEVTLLRKVGEIRDSIGGAIADQDSESTLMYLEPVEGHETLPDRSTPIGNWRGFGLPDVDFSSWDQLVYGELVLEFVSPPRPVFNPRLGIVSHQEMDLRTIEPPVGVS